MTLERDQVRDPSVHTLTETLIFLSKLQDQDDWKLNRKWFEFLDEHWGPHILDCFASWENKQLERYCARWWNPDCYTVDAFTILWHGEIVCLVPPVHLIARVVNMLVFSKCHGTLIVPEWTSAVWWPMLVSNDEWKPWIMEIVYLPRVEGLFVSGNCCWKLFSEEAPKCGVLALRICTVGCCTQAG